MTDDRVIHADKFLAHIPISRELADEAIQWPTLAEVHQAFAAERARFNALTPEEQARELADRNAQREAERVERTCPYCGCDPQDHGGY